MDILHESNDELRRTLDDISGSLPREDHPVRVAALRQAQAHGIELGSEPELAGIPLDEFTCFWHAFGLVASTAVIQIASAFSKTYPNEDFAAFLIAHYLTEVNRDEACNGDVVLYFNGGEISHAGKLKGGRVVSKWGAGCLWEHDASEVPARYGHEVRFYRLLARAEAEKAFVIYAKEREGADTIDLLLGS